MTKVQKIQQCAAGMWQAWQTASIGNEIEDDAAMWEDIMRAHGIWYEIDAALIEHIYAQPHLDKSGGDVREAFLTHINSRHAFNSLGFFSEICEMYFTIRALANGKEVGAQ